MALGKDELLRALAAKMTLTQGAASAHRPSFHTGLAALDAVAPGGAFQYAAVHEILSPPRAPSPGSFALLLAKAAQANDGAIVWSDPLGELYPPALVAAGIDLRRLILLRTPPAARGLADTLWALTQCLSCRGVSATVASIPHLTRVEARRLQLAAERGGGVGLFLRLFAPASTSHYAAATRWLVRAAPGDDDTQRWSAELLHGHGGRVGQTVLLEVDRETRALRASAPLADRSSVPPSARASA